jgi:hypothetical protein
VTVLTTIPFSGHLGQQPSVLRFTADDPAQEVAARRPTENHRRYAVWLDVSLTDFVKCQVLFTHASPHKKLSIIFDR